MPSGTVAWFDKPIDDDILEALEGNGIHRFSTICDHPIVEHHPKSYVRERLNELSLRGLCRKVTRNDRYSEPAFQRTSFGRRCLERRLLPSQLRSATHRIVDLSMFSAEDIKLRNTKFLTGPTNYDIKDHESQLQTRRQIWRVRNADIREVLKRFPRDKPLRSQCAYWIRGLTSKHFFPDANHRTSIALLRELLNEHQINFRWPTNRRVQKRSQAAIRESKQVRKQDRSQLDELYQRDQHYLVWWRYFVDVLEVEAEDQSSLI